MNNTEDSKKYLTLNPIKKKLTNQFLEDIHFYIKQLNPRTILDIGCGEGFVDQFLIQRSPHCQIRGIDISLESIQLAQKRTPKLDIQQGNAYNLPFKDNTFDLTIATEVLEHLNNPEKAIMEARRVSKKYCLFSVPSEPLFSLLSLLSGSHISRLGRHPNHINFWSKKSFQNLIQNYFAKLMVHTSTIWTIAIGEK